MKKKILNYKTVVEGVRVYTIGHYDDNDAFIGASIVTYADTLAAYEYLVSEVIPSLPAMPPDTMSKEEDLRKDAPELLPDGSPLIDTSW